MPKIYIFCHGFKGHGNYLWFKTVKPELEKRGLKVLGPNFPNSDDPRYQPWKNTLVSVLEENYLGNEIYFVTHSMGGYFLLRFLGETTNEEWVKSIKGGVLVSAPATKRPEYKPFYDEDINWEKIRSLPLSLTFIWSKDDSIVKCEHIELIKKELSHTPNFKYLEFDGFDHFCIRNSPEILKAVLEFDDLH